jgi:hypothetical protein
MNLRVGGHELHVHQRLAHGLPASLGQHRLVRVDAEPGIADGGHVVPPQPQPMSSTVFAPFDRRGGQ